MALSQIPGYMLGVSTLPQPGISANLGTPIYEQTSTLATSYAITTGSNAFSFGPITVADGVTIIVPDNTFWTIL
jgi:hypothetical protein